MVIMEEVVSILVGVGRIQARLKYVTLDTWTLNQLDFILQDSNNLCFCSKCDINKKRERESKRLEITNEDRISDVAMTD